MKYEKYKDSGVEWIGEIPEQWQVIKLGRLFYYIRTGLNPRDNFVLGRGDNYYVTIKNIKNGQVILDELCDYIDNDALQIIQNRSKLKKGDILFPSIGVDNLSFLIKEYPRNWNINESIFAITPNNKLIESEYLLWLLNSTVVSDQLEAFSTGSTFKSIKQNQLNKLVVAIPNGINEQKKISNYLDEKTSKIDLIIELLELQKEKLEQYKRELIAKVVTKGLDDNAPMKDSGVNWIDQIPKHWNVIKGKGIFKKLNRPLKNEYEIVTCFRDGEVTLRSNRRTKGFTESLKEIGYQGVKKGDLVIHEMDAFAGAIGVSDSEGKCTPVYSVCEIKNGGSAFYYAYLLREMAQRGFIESLAKGIRQRTVDFRFGTLVSLFYPVPPIEEQKKIANYLREKENKIDQIKEKIEHQIEKLTEYRKILIHEAVTGKIKIDGGAN